MVRLRGRHAARGPRHAGGAGAAGLPLHAGAEGHRRQCAAARHRLDRPLPARAGRPRDRGGQARRRSNPHRLAHDHRGRLPHQRRDRGVRGHPRRGRRPRARSRSRHGVRTRRRGSRPATAVRRRRLHRAVLRQRLRQRRGGPSQLHRVRRAQGPRARPVDGRARDLPQLDGRPDHAGHLRPGPPRPGRPVRGRRRVAGGRRAVRPVGAAGPLRRRPPRSAGRRGAARGRRGAVRADEAAAAQRQPPGARVPRAPRGLRLRARGVRGPGVRVDAAAVHDRGGEPDPAATPGHRPRRLPAHPGEPVRQPEHRRHPGTQLHGRLGPHPEVRAAGGPRPARRRGRHLGGGHRGGGLGEVPRGGRRAGPRVRRGRPSLRGARPAGGSAAQPAGVTARAARRVRRPGRCSRAS